MPVSRSVHVLFQLLRNTNNCYVRRRAFLRASIGSVADREVSAGENYILVRTSQHGRADYVSVFLL